MKKIIVTVTFLVGLIASYFLMLRPHSSLPEHLLSELPAKYGQIAASKSPSYLITDVSVIPMSRDTILAHQHVLIERGRIHQITPLFDRIDTSTHPVRINGQGQYLIPGLNDMHVHINDENNLLLFVANGVTTVRNMAGAPFDLTLRQKSTDGQILGPTLYTASPILEGPDNVWKFSVVLKNKQEARKAVLTYQQAGYDFIKVYHTLPADVYREILRVSDSLAIPVVGHIPFQLDLPQTLALSQYSLEHVDLRPISPQIPLVKKLAMVGQSKKWLCPTLLVYKNMQKHPNDPSIPTAYETYVDPQTRNFWQQRLHYYSLDHYRLQKDMAKLIFKSGGRFLTGTDCLNTYVLAGFSLHEELQELVNAGLPPYEVLKASTVNAAECLKRQNEVGTIEPGKLADLVLLGGNPLADIANTKRIRGVMVKGKWFTVDELNHMLEDVKKSYKK